VLDHAPIGDRAHFDLGEHDRTPRGGNPKELFGG
jgi:hypothetical protein